MKKSTNQKSKLRLVLLIILLIGASAFMGGLYVFQLLKSPKVNVNNETKVFFIKDIGSFSDLSSHLYSSKIISSQKEFKLASKIKRFSHVPKEGRYEIKANASYNDLINILRIGNRTPVKITFNNVRTKAELAGKLAAYLYFDSLEMLTVLEDKLVAEKYGFTLENFSTIFIPNTYQMYWSTTPEQVVERFVKESDKFWNADRVAKAKALEMTEIDVIVLASIVEEETIAPEEKSIVAGLYINRLKRNILLQADPTLRFAWNNFEMKRVLNKHKTIDSPYNTYKYAGLPPGPIRFPEISTIDAVLNYQKHNYLYMVAKPDFSGRHNFSKTLREHNKYADLYRRELNRRKIYR